MPRHRSRVFPWVSHPVNTWDGYRVLACSFVDAEMLYYVTRFTYLATAFGEKQHARRRECVF
jgi:hypothetical protein